MISRSVGHCQCSGGCIYFFENCLSYTRFALWVFLQGWPVVDVSFLRLALDSRAFGLDHLSQSFDFGL